jgi:hypothetical protein
MVELTISFVTNLSDWIAIGENGSNSLGHMVKYSKLHLNSSSQSYFWFL